MGVLTEAADALDGLGQPARPPALRQLVAERGEVGRVEVGHQQIAHLLVLDPHSRRQLARVHQGLLLVQEGVGHLLDRHPLCLGSGLAAGVQGVFLVEVRLQGGVGVGPAIEVVQLSPGLPGPVARGVRKVRELGIRLRGLGQGGGRGRMNGGQGDRLLNAKVTVATAGALPPLRPLSPLYRV
jgi:hypothetical protein